MNTFQRLQIARMWIEAWTDGRHADGRPYDRVALHVRRADDATGLRGVWFILDRSEVDALIAGRTSQFEDGYHRLSVSGDSSLFFDADQFPRADAGVMSSPYLRLHLPRAFWKYVRRLASVVWRGQRAALASGVDTYTACQRVELMIDGATYERFASRYGQGKGRVVLDGSERLMTDLPCRPGLAKCVERIEIIARNTTRNVYQTARAAISNDSDGYYFRAVTPSGRCSMNGAIVNHSRDATADDWSIHT